MNTPALDFCRKVDTWQRADGASSGLPVLLPDREQDSLAAILAAFECRGATAQLENRARFWLIGYRELVTQQGGLTPAQERELDGIVSQLRGTARQSRASRHPAGVLRSPVRNPVLWTVLVGLIVFAAVLTGHVLAGSPQGSPPAAGAPVNPAAGPQQGPLTDLQQFRADWDVPAAATADAGNPAGLVLLQDGLYYPAPWTIPAGDPGWVTDTTGSVAGTPVIHDGLADIADSNGTAYTVAIGQPFALASSPQVLLRVLRDATVQSMPQPHAIAVRHRL